MFDELGNLQVKAVISPPFGNYLRFFTWAVPIRGTFTYKPRSGIIKNILKTVRKTSKYNGWYNKMGLANTGLENKFPLSHNQIYSITAFNDSEWNELLYSIRSYVTLELNVSCPNIDENTFPSEIMLKKFVNKFPRLILKLPNGDINKTLEYYRIGKKCGIKCFHIGNTIKTDKGGLSGQFVKRMSISAIKYIRKEDKDSIIIGGGGIYSAKDVAEYKEAGANVFSLCTVFWTAPWKIWEIKKEIYKTNNNEK